MDGNTGCDTGCFYCKNRCFSLSCYCSICLRSETDITTAFEAVIGGSSPSGGTTSLLVKLGASRRAHFSIILKIVLFYISEVVPRIAASATWGCLLCITFIFEKQKRLFALCWCNDVSKGSITTT